MALPSGVREFSEPSARLWHSTVVVDDDMLLWGGVGMNETWNVETFDVLSAIWRKQRKIRILGDNIPERLYLVAVTSDKLRAYMFGGIFFATGQFYNQLFVIDLTSLECRELVPTSSSRPSGRHSCRMVYHERKLVIYGGLTDAGHSEELHAFDLETETWTLQTTTGEVPPPLVNHTLTMTDGHKATLFGGNDGDRVRNDTYVLDMKIWQWSKLRIVGRKPPPRNSHAACCIRGPNTTHLMVVGGVNEDGAFGDVWLLDLKSLRWCEVTLPSRMTARHGLSCEVFGCGPDFRVVVLFGGAVSHAGNMLSGTTLLLLSMRRGSWKVDRVVGLLDLVAPDQSLREQLRRLKGVPEPDPDDEDGKLDIDRDVPEVKRILQPLDEMELKDLFRELGLSDATLCNKQRAPKNEYLEELIRSWIMEKDNVMSQGGATWGSLQAALEKLGHAGIAAKI